MLKGEEDVEDIVEDVEVDNVVHTHNRITSIEGPKMSVWI